MFSAEVLLAVTANAKSVKKLKVFKEKHNFGRGKTVKNTDYVYKLKSMATI